MNTTPMQLSANTLGYDVQFYQNRTIDYDKPVKVYKNLHNHKLSIQQDGKVVCHANGVILENVSFKVSEAGRQRVIKTRQKSVNAFIVGRVVGFCATPHQGKLISYNPYKLPYFYHKDSLNPVNLAANQRLYCDSSAITMLEQGCS